jgi:tetratricopeptide (TPR) repeat protein
MNLKKYINVFLFSVFYLIILFLLIKTTIPLLNVKNYDMGFAYYRLFYWVFWGVILLITSSYFLIGDKLKKNKNTLFKFWIVFSTIFSFVLIGTVKSQIDNFNSVKIGMQRHLIYKKKYERLKREKENHMIHQIQNKGTAQSYYNYGAWLRTEGRWNEAIKNLKKSNELDSLNDEYHSELAYCLCFIEIGKYDEAIKNYKIAYKLKPQNWQLDEIDRCQRLKRQYRK